MKSFRIVLTLSAMASAGCVSNVSIVTRMAARDTACERTEIQVTELDPLYAGVSRYEASGCGITNHYVCGKWDNIVMAGLGYINPDPRPCARQRR